MNPKLRTVLVWILLLVAGCLSVGLGATVSRWGVPSWVPLLPIGIVALLAVLVALRQRAQGGQFGQVNAFRQNKARMLQPGAEKTRFTDVGGLAPAKETLGDLVDWLRAPERWRKANVRPPRGVLLEGPPGSGKTLLARAVAGEAGVKFFVANATEFVELYVGVGPARVRDLFEAAAKEAPCVIFIDEIDAIGRRRGSGLGIAHEEREQALNELLVQMDGFEQRGAIVVIGASNRADVLDAALLRPGRFDLRVRVGDLDDADREAVLRVHGRGRTLGPDADLAAFARQLPGASGALLELLMNRAALAAMRRARAGGDTAISAADLAFGLTELRGQERSFSALDQLLVESASQLAEPPTETWAEIELTSGLRIVGRLVWATPEFLKVLPAEGGTPRLFARRELREVRPVDAPEIDG